MNSAKAGLPPLTRRSPSAAKSQPKCAATDVIRGMILLSSGNGIDREWHTPSVHMAVRLRRRTARQLKTSLPFVFRPGSVRASAQMRRCPAGGGTGPQASDVLRPCPLFAAPLRGPARRRVDAASPFPQERSCFGLDGNATTRNFARMPSRAWIMSSRATDDLMPRDRAQHLASGRSNDRCVRAGNLLSDKAASSWRWLALAGAAETTDRKSVV